MAGEWPIGTLRDAIGAKGYIRGPFGSALRRPELKSSGVPVYEQQHAITGTREFRFFIDEEKFKTLKRFTVQPNDLIISCSGTLARVSMIQPEDPVGIISQALLILRPDTSVIWPKYLYYYLSSKWGYNSLVGVSTGSVQVNIAGRSIIEKIQLPLPSLAHQCTIAHILSTLDDKIELNRRMNETLEAMARALFKSWFVDFDPVRAKAEGRDTGLPKHIADLFPKRFIDSEMGEIPEGWVVKKLSDLCLTQYGYTASAVDKAIGPKLLRVTDINKRNWIEWEEVPHCSIEKAARAAYALKIGDIVVARMADPGKSAIIEVAVDAVFASYLVRLKTGSLAQSYFVYGFLKSNQYMEYAEGVKGGSVQANMNAKVIVGASLVVPPATVMEKFLRVILPLRQRLVANVCESRTLAVLRDTLLPRLISGELCIKDRDCFSSRISLEPSEVNV